MEISAASKETIRKCLLRYVDNILCLDDIQGVVSLHQLGLLPREEMNSYLDGPSGPSGSSGSSGGIKSSAKALSNGNNYPRRSAGKNGSLEDQMEMPGWDFLEGMLSGGDIQAHIGAEKHPPIHSLCASLLGMEVGGSTGRATATRATNRVSAVPAVPAVPAVSAVSAASAHKDAKNNVKKNKNTKKNKTTVNNNQIIPPVNVNARNSDGESALTFALKNEQLEMIQILVEKGKADVNMQNKDGNTELMMAARRGQTKMVKLLVEGLGANVHLRNKEGMTALMVAEKYERTEIVRFLTGGGGRAGGGGARGRGS